MLDTIRAPNRRWALMAVAVAVVLYGIVGFPNPATDPEPAAADRQEQCITEFWGAPVDPPHCVEVDHDHPPPPTTPPATANNNNNDNNTCGINYLEDANGDCVINYRPDPSTANCPPGTTYDRPSQLCINDVDRQDLDAPSVSSFCSDPRDWEVNGVCVRKTRQDDADRSQHCPAGQVFYSTLGCAFPCDAGEILVNGSCQRVAPYPPSSSSQPGSSNQPPLPPASCPVGFGGTPPNCVQLKPQAFLLMDQTVDEDGGTISVTVALSHAGADDATVEVSTFDGTATAGSDYTAVAGRVVAIAAGSQTASTSVTIIDDDDYDPGETFAVRIANAAGGADLGANTANDVSIIDNEPVPPPGPISNLAVACQRSGGAYTLNGSWTAPADVVANHPVTYLVTVARYNPQPGQAWSSSFPGVGNPPLERTAAAVDVPGEGRYQMTVFPLRRGGGTGGGDVAFATCDASTQTATPTTPPGPTPPGPTPPGPTPTPPGPTPTPPGPTPTPPPRTPRATITAGGDLVEGSSAVFEVRVTDPAVSSARVVVAAVGDFGAATGTRTVNLSNGRATVTVGTIDDTTPESNGTITATMISTRDYTLGSPHSATVAVADDDTRQTVIPTLSTRPVVPSSPFVISVSTGAAGICAEDHVSGGHGQITWNYDQRQSDLASWTSAQGHACCPTAVWHPYHDDGGTGFWSDAESDWWKKLDEWETKRRTYNAAVVTYNAEIVSYNAAVAAHNAAANPPPFTGTHPGPPPSGNPGPAPKFADSTVYADYANKDQGPLGCYPALPS